MALPLIACLVVLVASSAMAQSTSPLIRGRVVADENDLALARARVVVSVDGRQTGAILTDDRGNFVVSDSVVSDSVVSDSVVSNSVVSGFSRTGPAVLGSGRTSPATLIVTKAGYAIQHVAMPASAATLTVRLARAATIAGRVADASGEGVMETRVIAQRKHVAVGDLTPSKFDTTTDDLGEYRLGGLPAGSYDVFIDPSAEPNHVDLRASDEIASLNFLVPPRSDMKRVVAGPLIGQTGGAAISGRVLSPSGRPLADARVRAVQNGSTPRPAFTDREGRFTIAGLLPGLYTLEASATGYYGLPRGSQANQQVLVRNGETTSSIDMRLPREVAVTGTIVDEQGEPLQGVNVRALQVRYVNGRSVALNAGSRDRRTDDRGRYRLYGLQPGSYLVLATEDASLSGAIARGYAPVFYPGTTQSGEALPISVDPGRDVSAIDLVLAPAPAARLTIAVQTSDGMPFQGNVLLLPSQRSGNLVVEPQRPQPGGGGSFVFTNVPPGDYVAQALRSRAQNRGAFEFGAQFVSVVNADPKPLTIATSPGATLAGRVIVEDADGRPSKDASMDVFPFPNDFDRAPAIGGDTFSVSMTSDGTFSMAGLFGPTRFRLLARENRYLKSVTIGPLDITDVPFDFGAGTQTITGAEVVVSNAGASVSGHVTDATSAPVSQYSVVVFATDRSKWFQTSRFLKLAQPTQDGSFEVTGLPPGEYFVAATNPQQGNEVSGDWLTPETLEQLSFRATRVVLAERERFTTILRIIRR